MSGLEDRLRDARDALGDPDRAATERAHDAALGSVGDGRGRSRRRIAGALIAVSAAVGAAFAIGYFVAPSGASGDTAEPPDPGSSRPRAGRPSRRVRRALRRRPRQRRRTSPSAPTSSRARIPRRRSAGCRQATSSSRRPSCQPARARPSTPSFPAASSRSRSPTHSPGSAGGSAAQRHGAPPPRPPWRLERRPLRLLRRRGHGRCARRRAGAARPFGRSRVRLARAAKLGSTAIPASRQPLAPLELPALRGSDIVPAYR